MAVASRGKVYGHMRQRIVAVGRIDHLGKVSVQRPELYAKDKSLRILLRSGAITQEQLDSAVGGFAKAPADFVWLAATDEALLEKADRVFFSKYGRPPVNDSDFRLNGEYHRIYRSLQYDPSYYDSQLDESSPSDQARGVAPARQSIRANNEAPKEKKPWAFGAVLVLGFCTAPLLGGLIATRFPDRDLTAGLLLGGAWLLILFVALVVTFPRHLK